MITTSIVKRIIALGFGILALVVLNINTAYAVGPPDLFDFTALQDILDLDADLILNQADFTWTQNFTGTLGPGLTYNVLGDVTSGIAAGLYLNVSSALTSVPAMVLTNAGSSDALRINDDGTATDPTPFVIDAYGNVGIGTASPGVKLDVVGSIRTDTQLISTISDGIAPLVVSSTALVTNLNTDFLDGQHGDYYLDLDSEVGTCINCLTGFEIDESALIGVDAALLGGLDSGDFTLGTDFGTHVAATSAHGVVGDVVGTTDTQTLTNKAFRGKVFFPFSKWRSQGYLGIGTINPESTLHLAQVGTESSPRITLETQRDAGSTPPAGTILFKAKNAIGTKVTYGQIDVRGIEITPGAENSWMNLWTLKDGSFVETRIAKGVIESYLPTGTAPFLITSTTLVTNLNADLLDGKHAPNGLIVGTTDTQTLTNKTLIDPVINGGTITDLTSLSCAGCVGTSEIAYAAVTVAKLATSARLHVVVVQIGDVAAGTDVERPIFVPPQNGTIAGISFTNASAIAKSDTDFTTLSIERKTAVAATVKSITTKITGGKGFSPFVSHRFNPVAGADFTTGDVYSFKKVDTGAGTAIDEMLVTIEYLASE